MLLKWTVFLLFFLFFLSFSKDLLSLVLGYHIFLLTTGQKNIFQWFPTIRKCKITENTFSAGIVYKLCYPKVLLCIFCSLYMGSLSSLKPNLLIIELFKYQTAQIFGTCLSIKVWLICITRVSFTSKGICFKFCQLSCCWTILLVILMRCSWQCWIVMDSQMSSGSYANKDFSFLLHCTKQQRQFLDYH